MEAIDQTRGWFYTLLAISTLLGMKAPYKNVISLGHLLDEKGEKMSKSKGNVISPWEMIDAYGVDTLRWYFYTINHPWDSKLFTEKDLQGVMRKFMLTLWNSFVFYKTYRTAKNSKQGVKSSKNILDRWIVSRLNSVMKEMTKRLDEYDITGGTRILEDFVVNDVSLWYVRRSRARFQNPHLRQGYGKQDFQEAVFTLGYVLESISKLSAPFIPFLSEFLYQEIRRTDKESVHWQDWPKANAKLIDTKLENDMRVVRDIVAKGLAERARAGIRVRQPLQKLKIKRSKSNINKEMIWLIQDELNVKEVMFDEKAKKEIELDTIITPSLKAEGMLREILRHIQEMRKKAGYRPNEKVRLRYSAYGQTEELFRQSKEAIISSVGLRDLEQASKSRKGFDVEQEFSLDGEKLWIGIRK